MSGQAVEQFVAGLQGTGVPNEVFDRLVEDPPPPEALAPRLMAIVPRVNEQQTWVIADFALRASADPGYRRVVEYVLDEGGLGPYWRILLHQLVREELHGGSVVWWFDTITARPSEVYGVHLLAYHQPDVLLEHRREALLDHLTDPARGPAYWAAEATFVVLRRTGPCSRLEDHVRRWLHGDRFWVAFDAADGSTSVRALTLGIERCVEGGAFDRSWWLVDEAIAYWRAALSSADPERRRHGLAMMKAVAENTTLFGLLPGAVLSALADPSEAAALRRAFAQCPRA